MTTPRYRQLQILTVAFGVLALFGLDAYAQTCSVGTRDKGTTTIKQMSVLQGEPPDALFTVEPFGSCGRTLVLLPNRLARGAAASCKHGGSLTVSGVIRQKGKSLYLHADSARCS